MNPTRVTDNEAHRWECHEKKKKKKAADFVFIDGIMKTCGWLC